MSTSFTTTAVILSTMCFSALYAVESNHSIADWWEAHGNYRIKNLSSVLSQEYAEIPLNPDNVLSLPETTLLNEFRPEASLSYEHAFLEIKPRFVAKREYFRSGLLDGTEKSDSEFYINEWVAQIFVTPELSFSYGREDLQWGPAFLLSPSNPFDSKNGRTEPKAEVDGADYAKVTWTPNANWTITGIVNTDDGRKDYRISDQIRQDFRDIYALKVDYLFDRGNAGLVLSTTEESDDADQRLGYYISYNVNDSWITYSEGSASSEDEEFLFGNTYTFASGLNFSAEYFYNSSGILAPIPTDALDLIDFEEFIFSFPNREAFTRENYLLLQVYHNDIYRSLDLLLRYTHNLDDSSRSLLGHLEFDISDNLGFFTSATLNSCKQGELDSLREYWVQAGIEFSF